MAAKLNTSNRLTTENSGTTTHIDYSAQYKILEVEFINGDLYHYFNVPLKVWKEYEKVIKTGDSSGKFVNREVKPKYKFKKIR